MDPNATLTVLRQAVGTLTHESDPEAVEIGAHFQALDEWLTRGGFLPAAWDPPSRRRAASDQYGRR